MSRLIFILLLISQFAFGETIIRQDSLKLGRGTSTNKEIIFDSGAGASNPKFRWNQSGATLEFSNDGTTFKGIGSGSGSGGSGYNLIDNPGFEDGTQGFTNSGGTVAVVTSGSNLLLGTKSVTFDASATAQYFETSAYTVPEGLKGQNCLARVNFKGGDSNLKFQVVDGSANILGETTLAAATKMKPETINFPCPSSGTIKWKLLASGDAAIIALDNVKLGDADNLSQVGQAEMFGGIKYGSTNCVWSTTSTTYASFAADTDCVTPVLFGKGQAPATQIPAVKFASMPPGKYRLVAHGNFLKSTTTGASAYFRFSDGTTASLDNHFGMSAAGDLSSPVIEGMIEYTTAQSNVTIQIQGLTNNAAAPANINASGETFAIYVYRYPSNQELAYRPEQVAWRVDANLGGVNPSLGTAAVSSYTGVESGSLDLVNNVGAGTISAQIPCSGTNAPTGLTCAVGNESIGVSFNVPTAGDVLACASFTHNMSLDSANDSVATTFQLVETPNNAQTISQEGKSRFMSYRLSPSTGTDEVDVPVRVCGNFSFGSSGQKTLRLMFEQNITNTPVSSLIIADRSAILGQRDIHFEVYPLNNYLPAPLLVGSVITNSTGIEKVERVRVSGLCTSSPCTITDQSSNWISTIVRNAAGSYTVTINTGIFSSTPTCSCAAETTNYGTCSLQSSGNTLNIRTLDFTAAGVGNGLANAGFSIICEGPR